MSRSSVGVVIVTHEPGHEFELAIERLLSAAQPPDEIVVVDSGSQRTAVLDRVAAKWPDLTVLRQPDNIGYAAGNNRGLRALRPHRFVLFLNPDAVVTTAFLPGGVAFLERHPDAGALNPKLAALDRETLEPTGRIDSAGVYQRWYGRLFDRGQGEPDDGRYDGPAVDVPALCGAALLCRRSALESVAPGGEVFDEAFFMYKEDVDLSFRLVRAGWRLVLVPELVVHHCRGTMQIDRASTPEWVRRRSLANEWRLWRKGVVPSRTRWPMLVYLAAKTVAVRLGR